MSTILKISDLGRLTDCPVESIRFYEREGLLPEPARTTGNYRLYGREHVERLCFIRNCRSLDMTLDEIRQLLHIRDNPQGDCAAAHALLDDHVAHVAERIQELRRLERDLKGLRQACRTTEAETECALLAELGDDAASKARGKSLPHVRGAHRR
jgi:Cd(II)/Pb(II)-responsive transcriptional regulator